MVSIVDVMEKTEFPAAHTIDRKVRNQSTTSKDGLHEQKHSSFDACLCWNIRRHDHGMDKKMKVASLNKA